MEFSWYLVVFRRAGGVCMGCGFGGMRSSKPSASLMEEMEVVSTARVEEILIVDRTRRARGSRSRR